MKYFTFFWILLLVCCVEITQQKNIVIRIRRDLNVTESTEDSSDELTNPELPEAESLIWSGPLRGLSGGLPMPHGNGIGDLGQRMTNFENRLPPQMTSDSMMKSGSNQLSSLLAKAKVSQNKIPTIDGLGQSLNQNSIKRQYQLPQGYNAFGPSPRYPDAPSAPRPQQGYYPPPAFPSLGEAGASLLKLLNPLNLFRSYTPPQVPLSPNQLPHNPNPNQLPHNLNQLGYNPNQLPINSNHLRHVPQPIQQNNFYKNRQPQWSDSPSTSHGSDPFLENGIDLNKIKYEVEKDPLQHEYGHEFLENSKLREDIYVGKDGNLYIRNNNAPNVDSLSEGHADVFGGNFFNTPNQRQVEPPHGRYEEQEMGNKYPNEYRELLKNHNMNGDIPHRNVQDLFDEDTDVYDLNSLNLDESVDGFQHNNNLNAAASPAKEDPLDWMPAPPGRINYPSYFYVPRPVMLPHIMRNRPIRPVLPPRTTIGGLPPSPRYRGPNPHNPLYFPHSQARPLSNGYLSMNEGHNSILMPSSTRKTTRLEAINNLRTQAPTSANSQETTPPKIVNGHGFYPGNGFFDADFNTLFQMSPFKQGKEELPIPLHHNGSSLVVEEESTVIPVTKIER